MTKEYLSDEELQRLIDEAEHAPLLAAPSYLKTEILHKAGRIAAQPAPGMCAGRRMLPSSWRFAFYSLKVGLASAAAVLMLLNIPLEPGEYPISGPGFRVEAKENIFNGFTSIVDRKTNEFCGYLSELTNRESLEGGCVHDK